MMNDGRPPGLGGSLDGGVGGGFGHLGEAGLCYTKMAREVQRAGDVYDNVDEHVREIAALVIDLVKASGRMFEQEHLKLITWCRRSTQEAREAQEATGSPRKGSWSTRSL